MNTGTSFIQRLILWRTLFSGNARDSKWPQNSPGEDSPLRAELFSADQMEQHGKALAATHTLAPGRGPNQLLARLADNEASLVEVCNQLTEAVVGKERITPAGEWLLDNFYLIEEQISTAKRHLPKGYSQELPRLAGSPDGRPRVYDIALEIVSHGDGRVDAEVLSRFVTAYQTFTCLTLGELWAIPIMLRLAVIENLRRVSMRVAAGWTERNLADTWADQMTEIAEKDPKSLILVVADMARSNPPMASAFVAELARRLQGRGPALALPLTWIEQRLSETGLTIEQLVQSESQRQAADQVSISNSIGSLRVLGAMNWPEFVESMSAVERILSEDLGDTYARMDFATRDRYRHATERIAKNGRLDECAVAQKAIHLAAAGVAADDVSADRAKHVGFYLIGKGLPQLEQAAAARLSSADALRRAASRHPLRLYLGAIGLITVILGASLVAYAHAGGVQYWALWLLAGLSLLAASQVAVALTNWLANLLVTPQPLPKMDFSKGIPPESRTLVVVPTMLTSAAGIDDLAEALEVRFLANRDECLHFGLLTDFRDAAQQSLPEDDLLVQQAQTRIEELNKKYGSDPAGNDIFFLFHRPRRWNPQERIWMGYERKRGKLADLNAFLRGNVRDAAGERFSLVVGNTAILSSVKYVITLDTDTQLPRDAARQFVGAMAHPLNRPRYNEALQRVTEGYGILQPHVAISLPGTNRSHYARLYGGDTGIDPYTRALSNVYQDVFDEGSFIGKGIYDVDVFEQALGGRFPENRILSHDLIEGCYARSGLLSDVQLYEDHPARYIADVSRRHRWIRGDWQLAGWLRRRVPYAGAGAHIPHQPNPLSFLSQWKLLDNLRRSLVPVALTLMLVLGWMLLPRALVWTLAVIAIMLAPPLWSTAQDLLRKPNEVLLHPHLGAVARSAVRHGKQLVFEIACLPYEAYFSLDAIFRTIWRLLFSRRKLLEWKLSSEADREAAMRGHSDLFASFRMMWVAPATAIALIVALSIAHPMALTAAVPILLLWLISPAIAWWVSRPLARIKAELTVEQTRFLRALSRRTWAFFDEYVGEEDHWLPPDNVQRYRVAAVVHRTSPTNIGLALLANLSAYDFGYIPAGQLATRTGNTLGTMLRMERYRGHLYNWYDTQTLQPLPPLYISSVDSGNLAGHLLTLRAGLVALADERILPARLFEGLSDTFRLITERVNGVAKGTTRTFADILTPALATPPATGASMHATLLRLASSADALAGQVADTRTAKESSQGNETSESEASYWAQALARQCREALDELTFLAPWLALPAIPERLEPIPELDAVPTLRQVAHLDVVCGPNIERQLGKNIKPAQRQWLSDLQSAIAEASKRANERMDALGELAQQSGELADMEYDFLYDSARHLLSIGYNASDHRVDSSYYDLLASEARFCSFVAIAQRKLPQESWFALGRLLTGTDGDPVLLSWSGSMFEYLMPLLVMPTYDNTLLDQTCKAAVARQIEYGKQRDTPWGISESGYNTVDVHLNYQYRAFGVPGLGLKRGLAEDLVIAPYATALALMVAPEASCQNLQRLAADGLLGKFGLFEAVDYTPARQRRGQTRVIVHAFMAHHQGMSLLALAYQLLDRPMQKRFESERMFQSVMLLLQERIPKATALFTHTAQISEVSAAPTSAQMPIRVFNTPDTPIPEVQLLSNGRYHVMVTNAGGGYSRWKDIALTRWREDTTCDPWGTFCYIREVESGTFWSSAYQPTSKQPRNYEAIFSEGRAEFRRHDAVGAGNFETHTEIVVSPEDDIELRRIRITNRSRLRRLIDVTSYSEVVITPPAADVLHPAFSNLFVQTEILRERHAILCTRRPHSTGHHAPWMLHQMTVHGADVGEVSYETDRMRFIGRGRSSAEPLAMSNIAPLSGSEGSVLDPIVAIRHGIVLEPEQSVTIDIVTGICDTRDLAVNLVDKYQDRHLADRVFDLAWTHSQVVLRQLNATEADAQLHARLASSVIHANALLRAEPAVLVKNRRQQSGLWGYAISGDLPIVLLQIGDAANIDFVRQLIQAHAYWRLKGLVVDLVIWNEDHAGYRQQLQEQIMGLIASGLEASVIDRPGGIFVRSAEQISAEDRILFMSVARVIISDSKGSLTEQLDRRPVAVPRAPRLVPTRVQQPEPAPAAGSPSRELILFNGMGGFAPDGREYVIALAPGQTTPAPWVNVLANPQFGTVISENGSAYSWTENAHEFRLTPWHNDPVSDASGEAFYLRDDETGQFWSPTAWPVHAATAYLIRHGFGYSVFETKLSGIRSQLWVYVAQDATVKFSVLKLRNESGRARRLSATGYVEWVLGDLRTKSAMHVITEIDPQSGALLARNPYNAEFSDRVTFFDIDDRTRTLTGDRMEFLGRNGSLRNPAAMRRLRLSGNVGAGLDPCGALQVHFDLANGQEREIVFLLGVGRNAEEAGKIALHFRGAMAARGALDAVRQYWDQTLGVVQVETPDQSVNVLANGWLPYQTLACRIWARSGYYQSGGAFGFRDQLQDTLALIHTKPALVREHLLLCASRQFIEGDVQHWWHPPSGRGVRTRCSDDYLWLPLAVCRYVKLTGDAGVLEETAPFLEGRQVNPEDESYYDLPGRSADTASLYEHCVRSIRHGLRYGVHGLPLIGCGDWNDGMNLVGIHGKGESVWLGFFLCEVLRQFAPLATAHGDTAFAELCQEEEGILRRNIEQNGWDGQWYRRAYFDDGTPLGSDASVECRIDSIAQSWSVLSGGRDAARSRTAMQSMYERLVHHDTAIVQLLDPPFDTSELDPGYIRGYVPGVRENGGQYTHAAIWATMAFAELGENERAWTLFRLINPVNHALSAKDVATYKVEPYVVTADVYARAPHTGRGGWSWYTGSAGWMYRLVLESLLGLRREGDTLHFLPCLPADWPAFTLHYRYRSSLYHIVISQIQEEAGTPAQITVDGVVQKDMHILLADDQGEHHVEVRVLV